MSMCIEAMPVGTAGWFPASALKGRRVNPYARVSAVRREGRRETLLVRVSADYFVPCDIERVIQNIAKAPLLTTMSSRDSKTEAAKPKAQAVRLHRRAMAGVGA